MSDKIAEISFYKCSKKRNYRDNCEHDLKFRFQFAFSSFLSCSFRIDSSSRLADRISVNPAPVLNSDGCCPHVVSRFMHCIFVISRLRGAFLTLLSHFSLMYTQNQLAECLQGQEDFAETTSITGTRYLNQYTIREPDDCTDGSNLGHTGYVHMQRNCQYSVCPFRRLC